MRLENYFTSWRLFQARLHVDKANGRPGLHMLDELGARAAALENDLAFRKGGKLRPMTETVPSVNSRDKSPTPHSSPRRGASALSRLGPKSRTVPIGTPTGAGSGIDR
jgi:hypothetical protein